jgi:hypothetical protein
MSTPLSPAAQAVLDAVASQMEGGWISPDFITYEAKKVAAAFRAAADQMPSDYPASIEQMPEDARRWYRLGFGAAGNCDRSWLSAVATELEGDAAEPADLSHLSDKEFFDLCPQGHHAP